ncbi:hypothetical protein Pvag_pPag10104 (plasmid) [Pantoea vagans C9-1]|nr:hypothetical protein Pvag_pPag10104 [Pantoea vagans C9-1]
MPARQCRMFRSGLSDAGQHRDIKAGGRAVLSGRKSDKQQ